MTDVSEILKWQKNIGNQIFSNPETAFSYFKNEWRQLLNDDKENLSVLLILNCRDILEYKPDYSVSEYYATIPSFFNREKHDEQKACCGLILKYIENEFNGKPKYGKLTKGHSKNPKDIATIIKLLYNLRYFSNNIEEIAYVFSNIFDIKETTLKSYLNNPEKIESQDIQLAKDVQSFLKKHL